MERPFGTISIPDHEVYVGESAVAKATSTYVSYKIEVPQSSKCDAVTVKRRYREFVWLKDSLNRSIPGAIVPPLPPDAGGKGNINAAFINARKAGLSSFLNLVQEHPELVDTDCFR
jgi:hypothetical protein